MSIFYRLCNLDGFLFEGEMVFPNAFITTIVCTTLLLWLLSSSSSLYSFSNVVVFVNLMIEAYTASLYHKRCSQTFNLGQHPVVLNSNKITVDHNKKC